MTTKIALAGLLAVACSTAAQAQNVTLYGRLDMALAYQTRLFSSPVNGVVVDGHRYYVDSGGGNGSRWGVRGNEDLGGGLKAVFVAESGFMADTGVLAQGGRAFGRQVYVGLEGGWGRLTLGRQYSPWFDTLSLSDPFGNNLVGNSGNVEQANSRVDNAIVYGSPRFGGFSVQALVAPGERSGSSQAGLQANLALRYQSGPLWVGAVYAQQSSADEVPPAGSGHFSAATTAKFALLGASYDFGLLKLFGNYAGLSDMNPVIQPLPLPLAGAKGASWLVGATAPILTGTAIVSMVTLDDKRALDRDARQLAVGYTYPMSKRTLLYTAYARMFNENGGSLTVNTPSYPGTGEVQFQAGISHGF